MSVDKLVDSTQLDSDLTSVANAIRTKGGTSAPLFFPDDFITAIMAITRAIEKTLTGNPINFNIASKAYLDSFVVQINPVQSGSGYPSPSNVRPISGYSDANIHISPTLDPDDGTTYTVHFGGNSENIWDPSTSVPGYIASDGSIAAASSSKEYASSYITIPSGVSSISVGYFNLQGNESGRVNVGLYGDNYAFIARIYTTNVTGQETLSFSQYPSAKYVRVSARTYNHGIAYCFAAWGSNLNYEPYDAMVYYGGTLNVLTGVLTVTKANIASYAGETLPGEWISDRDVYAPGTTPTIGAQVVYDIATPQTVQLTPQEVNLLIGENNVWTDTNGDITIEYTEIRT